MLGIVLMADCDVLLVLETDGLHIALLLVNTIIGALIVR